MAITTHLAAASTPVTGAGCHPLADWLATQSDRVRASVSYQQGLVEIQRGLTRSIVADHAGGLLDEMVAAAQASLEEDPEDGK